MRDRHRMIPPRGIATRLQKRLAHEVREGKEHGPPLRGRELEVPRFQGCLVTVRGERTGAGLAATANRPCPSLKVLVNSGVGEVGLPKSPEEQADVYIDNTSNKEDVHPIKQTFDGRLHFWPQKIVKEHVARMVVEPKNPRFVCASSNAVLLSSAAARSRTTIAFIDPVVWGTNLLKSHSV